MRTADAVIKTVVVTDLVDSTALLEKLGDERASLVFARCDRAARSRLAAFGGREIDKTDGFLLLFDRPIDACRYVLTYHKDLAELSADLGLQLQARGGIHLGEVLLRENSPDDVAAGAKPIEVEGLAKPTASRLAALAQGRQTLLTRSAFELARRATVTDTTSGQAFRWLAHGSYLFKGVDDPLEVFEVGAVGDAPLAVPPDSERARRVVTDVHAVAVPPSGPMRAIRWAATAALVIAVLLVWWLVRRAPRQPAASTAVLVGSVENRTGDSTFDQMLPELLTTTLEQSHAITVFPQSNLPYVLRRMQRDPATLVDEAVGRDICQREGLSAVVLQSITRLGNSFVLVVRAVLPDGRLLASTQQSFGDASELPRRMDAVGRALRQGFGESAASIAQASVPLAEVTSQSLEAVRFFTLGKQRNDAGDPRGGLVYMQKAVELDPGFAMAHAGLGIAYTNLLDMVRAEQHFRAAASNLSRMPEIEREKILGYLNMIRGNYDVACPHYEVLTALRPRDSSAFQMLGWCSALRLDFTKAVSATEKGYELQPTAQARVNRAAVAFLSGSAERAFDEAAAVRREAPGLIVAGHVAGQAQLALGQFDTARGIYQSMVSAGGDSEIEGHAGLADLARSTGLLDQARKELEAQLGAAERRGDLSAVTSAATQLAELALIAGQPPRFLAALARVPAEPSDILLAYRVGRTWARGGKAGQATGILTVMDRIAPERARQYDALKAMLRAEIAIGTSRAADAVKEAEAAVGFEPSTVALETLARAYIAANRGADAIRPLERMLARSNERCESYDAPACYRVIEAGYWLGRVKAETGDHAGAAPLLEKFVATWSAASGEPMLADAKKRLAGPR